MSSEFEHKIEKYAEVILKIGLNLQPGQRLLIGGPTSSSDGISFEAAPLVHVIAKKAYQMGARLVDVIWGDEQLRSIRFRYGPKNSIKEYPKWRIDARYDISQSGDANLLIMSPNPDLLNSMDTSLILKFQFYLAKHLKTVLDLVSQYYLNWLIISAPTKAWADKILPEQPSIERIAKLWDIIFDICRITKDDPISAWQEHDENLHKRCNYLNKKQYSALKLTSPETNLTIGLPKDHIWHGGSVMSKKGIKFIPNLPTEEIFTIPDKNRVDGVVKTTKPIFHQGLIVEEALFTFSKGRIVNAKAKIGEDLILKTIDFDEGARRLGEIALVPHSSPISKTDLIFYNGLIDENASCHIALGQGFKYCLKNGENITEEDYNSAGGNSSIIHIDMMIGSPKMDVDGIREDNTIEPVMRHGEWAFDV